MSNILEIDPRLYDLIRQKSIRTVPEALVELVTNCYDAYKSAENTLTGSEISGLPIDIESVESKRIIIVRDQAKGMTKQEMTDRILRIGSLTAEETSRGMMGRGAKDITNIGNVRFISIKNNKISEVLVSQDLSYEWFNQDYPITPEVRQKYKIQGNGLQVEINVNTITPFMSGEDLYNRVCKNMYLRNIITKGNHPINVNGKRVVYNYPKGNQILNIDFDVEGYPEANATLKIYKVDKQISNPMYPDELEFGIIVSTSKTIYQCGGLMADGDMYTRDYRWNPNLKYIYGELRCDYIDKLAREITTQTKTEDNPFLVIDPSRRTGLSQKHPFTNKLFEIPYRWLEVTLNRIQDIHEDFIDTGDSISSFLEDVTLYIQERLEIETVLYTWRSKGDQENLSSMVGRLNSIEVDENVLNIDKQNIENIINGDQLVPVPIPDSQNKPNLQIKISDDPEMGHNPYDIIYFSDRTIIKINANDQSLKPFVKFEDNVNEYGVKNSIIHVQGEAAMVSMSDTIREAVVHILTRQHIMKNPNGVTTDTYNSVKDIQSQIFERIEPHTKVLYDKVVNEYFTK